MPPVARPTLEDPTKREICMSSTATRLAGQTASWGLSSGSAEVGCSSTPATREEAFSRLNIFAPQYLHEPPAWPLPPLNALTSGAAAALTPRSKGRRPSERHSWGTGR